MEPICDSNCAPIFSGKASPNDACIFDSIKFEQDKPGKARDSCVVLNTVVEECVYWYEHIGILPSSIIWNHRDRGKVKISTSLPCGWELWRIPAGNIQDQTKPLLVN